jgi:hypothetical protein
MNDLIAPKLTEAIVDGKKYEAVSNNVFSHKEIYLTNLFIDRINWFEIFGVKEVIQNISEV